MGAMIDGGAEVRILCEERCGSTDLDVAALAARVGRDYSLIGRRCRCRITPGCAGWNHFYYLHGVFRPLWSDADLARWSSQRLAAMHRQ
ncbi:hypothetical protein [Sphingomonas sp. 3-13AW]|uniref:hypothetical protein n=1 Tax=Sphingomonas sp. 3-13AW TaxID=3050450 RepID=UPI003BB5A1CB